MPGLKLSLPADTLPGVDHTAALLRAALRQRRNAVTILEELAHRAGQPRTRALAAQMARQLPDERVLLQNPLVSRLAELGGDGSLTELAALAYFIDLERGALGPEALRDCPPPLTEVAAFAVTRHLLWTCEEEAWDHLFPGTYAMVQQACRRPPLPQILQSLRQLEQDKSPLDLLHELTSQSRSQRCLAFLDGAPDLEVLPCHTALGALLSARGKVAPAALLAAMGAFADVELGVYAPRKCTLYALMVTAAALDVKLVPLAAPDACAEELLLALCRMSGGGLLAAYPDGGLRYLPTEEDVREHPGCNGQALAALPLCLNVTGEDLEGARWPFLACFATEDGAVLWRQVGTCDPFEHYGQTFAFTGAVAATMREGPDGPVLELPELKGLPPMLHELSRSALVGQRDELLEEARALADLSRALKDVLHAQPDYRPLGTPQLARLCLFDPGLRTPLELCPELRFLAEKPQFIDTMAVCLRAVRDGRALPFEPLRRLLDHPEATTRAAAAHLLAYADEPRLVLEYELMRLRFDECPEVCAAARRSLARLVVGQALPPLPPARPPSASGGDAQAPDDTELTAQLRRMGLSPARARTQAEWLAGLQHALGNRPGFQYLALLEPERIGSLRKHALISWRRFAKARDTSLTLLVASCNPLSLRVDYETGVRWPAPEIITIQPDRPMPLLDLLAGGGSRSRVIRLLEPMPLDPWRVEIYQHDRRAFAPLMHPFCPEIEERFEDYELLTNLYPRPDLTDWRALARDLGRTFELPDYQHRTILRMLLQLGRGAELAGRS